jgi:hypothetical protein
MIARIREAVKMLAPLGTPVEQLLPDGAGLGHAGHQGKLHMHGEEGGQHEEAPHAVDDGGDAGEQLDGDGEGPGEDACGQNSVRKTAMPMATGRARIRARRRR